MVKLLNDYLTKRFQIKKAIFVLAIFLLCAFFNIKVVLAQEKKIVVSNAFGQVIFYNLKGDITSSFFLPEEFWGSTNLAVGDVDGDFENEIVVASKQKGFQVGVFSENGILKYSVFSSFDKLASGGQELTLGDLDDDGKEEIIVAPHKMSYVKIFNYQGKLLDGFFAFSKNFRGEIKISVGDTDRDRKDEIIFLKKDSPSRFFIYKSNKSKRIFSLPVHLDKDKFALGFNVALGDLEGDGKDEALFCSFSTNDECFISRFNHEIIIEWSNNLIIDTESFLDLEDVDGDGKTEAILGEAFGGRINIYKLNDKTAQILKTIYSFQNISDVVVFAPNKKTSAKVIYIDDGDTIFLDSGQEVRYIGIDTPEIGEKFYLAATNKNKELIYGKEVILEYDKQKIDPYGRHLAYVFADGKFINLELVKAGFAKADFIYPDVKYAKELEKAEKETKKKKVGLWK